MIYFLKIYLHQYWQFSHQFLHLIRKIGFVFLDRIISKSTPFKNLLNKFLIIRKVELHWKFTSR